MPDIVEEVIALRREKAELLARLEEPRAGIGYPTAIAAAHQASAAVQMLLLAATEQDLVPYDQVLTALCDAARLVIGIEDRSDDNQLLGALTKWLEENGAEVLDV